jgi:hypothetical protein
MKIEKLDPAFIGSNAGSCGASVDEVVLKINEVIDVLNGEQTLEEKSEIPNNLDDLLDDYFEKLVVPEHQIIFKDTYRKIATDFFRMGQGASEKPMNLDLEIEIEDTRLEFCDEVDGITIEIIAKRFYELGRNAK